METCGYAPWAVLAAFLGAVDLFLFDVKLPDERSHREHTGVGNDKILANLRRLVAAGAEVTARVPLIPGINDDEETVAAIAGCVAEAGARRIALLPFNPATAGKYSWLSRPTPFEDARRQSPERVRALERGLRTGPLEVVAP
jgi:pyruvate formate lyase activating enzyme